MALEGVIRFPDEYAQRYRERGYWDDRLLIEHWDDAFEAFSERVALIDDQCSWTYAEFAEKSRHLARVLVDLGLRPLDRIVVLLPNTNEFACLYVALQRVGAIPIMALPSHRYREIEQFVRLSGAVAVASPVAAREVDFRDVVGRVRDQHDSVRWHFVVGDDNDPLSLSALMNREPTTTDDELLALREGLDPEDPAVFQLSGGTTGIPKLIPRSHNDYAFNSHLAGTVCDIREGDVLLNVLPISHNLPLACPGMQGFAFRGATVALSASTRGAHVFERIERDRCTHLALVPALLIRLINDDASEGRDLTSMRVVQSGGQRLQPETRRAAKALFPSVTVQENFGMAEGLLMFVRLDDPEEVRMETVGRTICPDDEVRIVGEDGIDVAPGEVGELWARGPYTLRGYYNAPEHNARVFSPDGFYMSGDLMWQHPSGNYVVAGRTKDLINRGGEKISAEEVENLILMHPSVLNVACIPVPHPVMGEQMCACVIVHPGAELDLASLVAHLEEFEVARHKLPEQLQIVDSFPLSPVGKVSKKDLVAGFAAQFASG